jgi:hypothetical protein
VSSQTHYRYRLVLKSVALEVSEHTKYGDIEFLFLELYMYVYVYICTIHRDLDEQYFLVLVLLESQSFTPSKCTFLISI